MMQSNSFYSPMSSTYPMTPQMSSYSSYPTQFSQYPQPQPQQGQIPVEQPTNFRSEYQGILHGLNCWVNLLYAGLGMFSYGKTFYKMSVGVLKTISQAALKLLMKVFGFKFLGKVIEWLGSFRRENNSDYDNLWSGMAPAQINTRLGKMLLCLRVLLLFGMGLSYILKRKLENKRKQRVLKRNKENNESIIGLQQVTISGSTDINEDTHVVEEIKGEIEEKMEKALDEEVNKTKEVYLGFRSEDFWKNKAHLQESEENKEEKTDMLKLAAESQELYKTNKENESNLVDLKKEKVTAPVGAKPWKTMKKAI